MSGDEPIPSKQPVEAPDVLQGEARKVWDQLAPDVQRKAGMTFWDADLFACWCAAVGTWRFAQDYLNEWGDMIEGDDGMPTPNPALKMRKDAEASIASIGSKFGMSPSDRGRMMRRGGEQDKNSIEARFFTGGA